MLIKDLSIKIDIGVLLGQNIKLWFLDEKCQNLPLLLTVFKQRLFCKESCQAMSVYN